ncbi:MAG: MarR family winged helix-turn-helix transcriptional regulator [Acidimicrobiales bacterium]
MDHTPVSDVELASELLASMASVRRTTRRVADRPESLFELTGSQLELVRLLRRLPALSVAEAAVELRLAANTVSTLVGQLVDAGFVVRVPDPTDRRVARLELAPETSKVMEAWRDRRVDAVATAMGRLTADEQEALATAGPVLARLADALHNVGGER